MTIQSAPAVPALSNPGKPKKVTLLDVAQHAGVSRATASLVLRGSPLVADKTRQEVLSAMKTLGYVYNRAAANLRAQKSHTIGLVVTDITNPFFAELAVSIEAELENLDYTVMLCNSLDNLTKQDRLLRVLSGHMVDGIVICPAQGSTQTTIQTLEQWQIPVVLVARHIPGSDADYAGADNILGASMAVDHFVAKGHTRIAFLGGTHGSSARNERLTGYQQALKQHNLIITPEFSVTSPVSRQGGFDALTQLLDLPAPPTAALCYNDVVAFGAMLGLQARTLTPGRDFSIIGFDDIADAALVRPSLTTIAINPREIGQAATSLLLDKLQNPDKTRERRVLHPHLVVRETTGAY